MTKFCIDIQSETPNILLETPLHLHWRPLYIYTGDPSTFTLETTLHLHWRLGLSNVS